MSTIRPTYSGLIFLIVSISTIFTGLMFTVVLTRNLSQLDYGTWGIINSILVYGILYNNITTFWITREIARGTNSAITGLFSNSIFAVIGITIYVIIAYIVSFQTDVDVGILLLGIILIPLISIWNTFVAINMAWKPHVASYGVVTFAITQSLLVVFFFAFMELGIFEVILSTAVAKSASILILVKYTKKKIQMPIQFQLIKKWLKLSWVSLYPNIVGLLSVTDVIIFSIIIGSAEIIAFWVVSFAISNIVSNTQAFVQGAAPKLLREEGKEFLKSNINYFFYFTIPLSGLIIIFSKPALYLLNPIYETAYLATVFLTFTLFFRTISNVFQSYIIGDEKVDKFEFSSFKDYAKSSLFSLPTIQLIKLVIYLSVLTIGIFFLVAYSLKPIELIIFWSITALSVEIPVVIYLHTKIKKKFELQIISNSLLKYLTSTIIISLGIFFVINEYLEYDSSFFIFFPRILIFAVLFVGAYFGITYFIDSQTRLLVKAIINEIKNRN
jgi:O-antigen/teichoic acid export membrane protein